jgi:2-dehydropantoate 2-reductase
MAEALRRAGLRLEGAVGAQLLTGLDVLTDLPPSFDLGPSGYVLLTVRAFDAAAAAATLAERLRPPRPVVCLLNGVGNEETVAQAIGWERVLPAVLTTAVEVRTPGVVRVERERGLGLGAAPEAELLAGTLRAAGISTRVYGDWRAMKWSKVPLNIMANASSAILDWPARAVLADSGLYRLELEAQREAFRVMRRAGHAPVDLPGVPVQLLEQAVRLPPTITRPLLGRVAARGRGAKRPSLHRDIGRGRSEVPWLNGAIVEHGRRLGLPTQANAVLLETLLALVEGRADPAAWRDQPQRLLEAARSNGVPGLGRPQIG